jgi:two-component system chemotaxis response regulator CheB
MRVLIVDDSVVFRSQIKAALDGVALIEVVGTANNGKIALQKLAQSSIDLVTLDMEMPEMGGLETIREIRKAKFPVRIIVFSAQTARGSAAALDALAAGADDLVAKPSGDGMNIENAAARIKEELLPKVLQFINPSERPRQAVADATAPPTPAKRSTYPTRDLNTFLPSVIVIGSSTGGPPVLEKILNELPKPLRIPILIAQHMPPVFTASLAKRIQDITGIEASEGKNDEEIQSNHIYVAPGGYHLTVKKEGTRISLKLDQNPPRNSVRPAVDTLFESAVKVYGTRTMAFILTGMGEDGLVGSSAIKQAGGGVMIQDKPSCVVFGMPGAVFAAGLFDQMGTPNQISSILKRMTS